MPLSSRSAIIDKAKLDAVNETVHALFNDAMEEAGEGPLFDALTMPFRSNQKVEEHVWAQDYVELREWVGPRQFANIEMESMRIPNKSYEASISLSREDLIFDRTGLLDNRVRRLTEAYFKGRRKILADMLVQAHTTTGPGGASYDGVAFFSDSHPNYGLAAQSNIAPSGTALTGTNYDAAVEQMELLVNHKGEPMDITPDTLVIGPKLRSSARDLFQVSTQAQGGANPYFQIIPTIIVEKRITDNSWYLFDTTHAVKPFVDQQVVDLELASQVSPDDPRVFDYNQYAWGIYALFGIGLGMWQTAYRNAGV